MRTQEKKERNKRIFKEYSSGTFSMELAKKYNLSHQRIQQILIKFPEYKIVKEKNHSKKYTTIQCANCGIAINKLKSSIRECCSKRCSGEYRYKKYLERMSKLKTKICSKCRKRKKISEFYFITMYRGRKKYQSQCKKCHAILTNDWSRRHKEEKRKINRRATEKYNRIHSVVKECEHCKKKMKLKYVQKTKKFCSSECVKMYNLLQRKDLTEKKCAKCRKTKKIKEFYFTNKKEFRRSPYCRKCVCEISKKYYKKKKSPSFWDRIPWIKK
jgi:hypothetical protein